VVRSAGKDESAALLPFPAAEGVEPCSAHIKPAEGPFSHSRSSRNAAYGLTERLSMTQLPTQMIIATMNQGKLKEVKEALVGLPIQLLSLRDYPLIPEIVEDGLTFTENALKKARAVCQATGLTTLADDSGLCVDALEGRPGVFSARYAGQGASDEENYRKVLQEMKDVPDAMRSAHFVCVLALVEPDGQERIFEGSCQGRITKEPIGNQGFGYDPIFFFEPMGVTFAEIDSAAKSIVSHRGKALRQFAAYIRRARDARI
jgi:XTP/dITP diphosphohydrolase